MWGLNIENANSRRAQQRPSRFKSVMTIWPEDPLAGMWIAMGVTWETTAISACAN